MKKQLHYYFIGIGGIGMSALAKIAIERGAKVSGSDLGSNATTQALESLGVCVYKGHNFSNVKEDMIVIYNSMIAADNPELNQAKELKLKIYHRSELLDEFMKGKKSLLVTGCHGKTSTTAMLATILIEANRDPSFVVGGYIRHLMTNGKNGSGEYFVAEADESDGSFLRSKGWGAIITNAEEDHLAYWKSKENLLEGYKQFINQTENKELLFLCIEDPFLKSLGEKACYYGFSKEASLRILQMKQEGFFNHFDLFFEGKSYIDFKMPLQGIHQVLNATAAIGMALRLGISEESIKETLKSYQGVKRRLEFLGEVGSVKVFDDYAHHPTEVVTTLKAIKQALPNGRLVVVFQPHRYTRLKDNFLEFAGSFELADVCMITDVYSAGESPIKEINSEALVAKMSHPSVKRVSYEKLIATLIDVLQPSDTVITLGAGDITHYGPMLLRTLQEIL